MREHTEPVIQIVFTQLAVSDGVQSPVILLVVPMVEMAPVPRVAEPAPEPGKRQRIFSEVSAAHLVQVQIAEVFQIVVLLQMEKAAAPEILPIPAMRLP